MVVIIESDREYCKVRCCKRGTSFIHQVKYINANKNLEKSLK